MASNISFDRLRGRENYSEWRVGAKAYLITKNHWDEMEVKLKEEPSASDRSKNQKALADLTLLLEPSLYSYIEDATDAKTAWDTLVGLFENKGAVRKVTLLKSWISLKAIECNGIHDYVNKSVTLQRKIKTAGFEIDEEVAACIMLAGLGDEYKSLVMSMEVKDELTSDYVKNILLQSIDFDENKTESAMSVKKSKNQNKNKNKKKQVKCYECGGPHYKNKCPNKKNNNNSEKSDIVLWTLFNSENVPFQSKNVNICAESSESEIDTCLYSAMSTKDQECDDEWYIDSGATKHMTKIAHNMQNVKQPLMKQVKAANGEMIDIKEFGDLKCRINDSDITLRDVHYIPKLCVNLLSVSQMVIKGFTIVFDSSGCKI